MARQHLVVISAKVDPPVKRALASYAKAHGLRGVSEALRVVLGHALSKGGALSDSSSVDLSGYNDGLRRGSADAHKAIRDALADLWT